MVSLAFSHFHRLILNTAIEPVKQSGNKPSADKSIDGQASRYRLYLVDGSTLSGLTLGHVQMPFGLFLYTPVNDQTIRLTYNRAFKTPTILNNYFSINDFVKLAAGFGGFGVFGNKEGFTVKNAAGTTLATYQPLVPEENTTYEVGYKGILKDRVFIDAAYYQADYKDFISPLVTINSDRKSVV